MGNVQPPGRRPGEIVQAPSLELVMDLGTCTNRTDPTSCCESYFLGVVNLTSRYAGAGEGAAYSPLCGATPARWSWK